MKSQLEQTMKSLYCRSIETIPKPPDKIQGEFDQIMDFGFGAFQAGFMSGVRAGEMEVDDARSDF